MGNLATGETLALRWAEVCRDPSLQDLPYKIELNSWGKIEMSPASYRHALLQGRTAVELGRQLSGGEVLTECPVLTEIGIRVPDVAWASDEFIREFGQVTPYPKAPEICVEVVSPSKQEFKNKIELYLAKGALEVWSVNRKRKVAFIPTPASSKNRGSSLS